MGEHVLKKRLEDGLSRKQLASRMGVDESTVMNWELGRTKTIPARVMPAMIAYLGYNPEPKPTQIGAQLRWKRRSLGWTTAEAARRNSVDQSTWEAWETLDAWPRYPRYCRTLQEFVEASAEELGCHMRQAPLHPQRRCTGPL